MESTFEKDEQTYAEIKANQMEEDEADLDIMLVVLNNIATTYPRSDNRIQCLVRRPITNIGYDYIQNALKENPKHFRSLYRMYPSSFEKFFDLIRMKTCLRDTWNICVEKWGSYFVFLVKVRNMCT